MREKFCKPGFINLMYKLAKKLHPDITPVEIYEEMGISKQEFFSAIKPNREVKAANWPKWRKGLNIKQDKWWAEAQKFYESE